VSRFADPNAVDTFEVACPCPGTPHEQDKITHRTELGAGELESVGQYGWQRGMSAAGTSFYDESAAMSMLVQKAVVRWSFTDSDGDAMPVNVRTADLLPESIRSALRERLEAASAWDTVATGPPVPNASGAPSRRTSRASASPARTNGRSR
jgi:hypothetical protein